MIRLSLTFLLIMSTLSCHATKQELTIDSLYIPEFDKFLANESSYIPDFIYEYIVKKVKQCNQKEFESYVQHDLLFEECMRDPDEFRGKIFRVTGVIGKIWIEGNLWAGYLYPKEARPVLFHAVEPPEMIYLNEDLVQTEGILIKIIHRITESGLEFRCPFLIVKRFKKLI